MWALALCRRNLARRNQPSAEQPLLVISIQMDDAHDQILHLSDEETYLRLGRTFRWRQILPEQTVLTHFAQNLIQAWQKGFPVFTRLAHRAGLLGTKHLRLAFSQAQEFTANDLQCAQIRKHLKKEVHFFIREAVLVPDAGTGLNRRDCTANSVRSRQSICSLRHFASSMMVLMLDAALGAFKSFSFAMMELYFSTAFLG